MTVHNTTLSVEARVHYKVLPEADGFPAQIDIKTVVVKVGKRSVNILGHFDEPALLLLEDEIQETYVGRDEP